MLTIADLPGILVDLARLAPERYEVPPVPPAFKAGWTVLLDGARVTIHDSLFACDLALVQAACQEEIRARGWTYSIWYDHGRARGSVRVGPLPTITREADHAAVALAGALRDALRALQAGA